MQQLLLPQWLLPVRPAGVLLEAHAVLICDGRIQDIAPREAALEAWPDAERIHLDGQVLLPGLVNMHTHSPMTLLRGLADDLRLDVWLKEHIWPAEARWVGPEFVADGTELAMAEMLRGGTSCFNEMYFFPEVIAEKAQQAGMRAAIGMPIIDVETPWAGDVETCLRKAREAHSRLQAAEHITMTLAPHALYTVNDQALQKVAEMSAELNLPVYMHVLEIAWEIKHSYDNYGIAPLQRLNEHGLLGPGFQAVHMAHVGEEDIALLAGTGTHVVHCPESNLKLASGICPVPQLMDAGVNVCLGTDGAASNNNLDLIGEMRTAALLAKGTSMDPCALKAGTAIEMLTINAAKAMGLEASIGSIEQGKMADLCAIDLRQPETQPVHNVVSQIVYAAASRQVSNVWVAGRRLLKDGELTTIDLEQVLARAAYWNRRLETPSN